MTHPLDGEYHIGPYDDPRTWPETRRYRARRLAQLEADRRARLRLACDIAGVSLGMALGALWRWALRGMTGPVIAATVVTVVTGLLIALVVAATAHTKETA